MHLRRTYKVKRGDKFDGINVVFKRDGFNFTGTTVKAELRDKPDGGDLIYTFSVNVDTSVVGEASVTLTIPGSSTAGFPVNTPLFGDVEIYGPGDFGPYTPVDFIIMVEPDITT
jgi:hypothetical protein